MREEYVEQSRKESAMTMTRFYTDVPINGPERLQLLAILKFDGARIEEQPQSNNSVTIIATFDAIAEPAPELPAPGSVSANWMDVAQAEIGVKEGAGAGRIEQYHASTKGGSQPDSVPWCSSFVNFCIEQGGLAGTDSKRARSWVTWGEEIDSPRSGAIVVFSRGNSSQGHVGFFAGMNAGRLLILGGNQSNAVNISEFSPTKILAIRWPND